VAISGELYGPHSDCRGEVDQAERETGRREGPFGDFPKKKKCPFQSPGGLSFAADFFGNGPGFIPDPLLGVLSHRKLGE